MTAKDYKVKLVVRSLEGWKFVNEQVDGTSGEDLSFFVQVDWANEEDSESGKKKRRMSTRKAKMGEDGVVLWDEEFSNECLLGDLSDDEGSEIEFQVLTSGKTPWAKNSPQIGTTSVDLSQLVSTEEGKEFNLSLPLLQTRNNCGTDLLLCITVSFSKLGSTKISPNAALVPSMSALSPPQLAVSSVNEQSETEAFVKKIVVYTRRAKLKKGGNANGVSERNNDSGLFIHHNQPNSNDSFMSNNGAPEASLSELIKSYVPSSAKRKRSNRGSKNRREQHPLEVIPIEDSEDDVESLCHLRGCSQPLPQNWQQICVVSRDALLKLQTQVLFASIDQRSEQAGGSSACSALVVVISNWLHANKGCLPDQSQFDSLIKEGSLEWRQLQKNGGLMQLYADGHFEIKTVLHIRPICIDSAKTIIGFFHPEGLPDEVLGFLSGTTSFEDLWKEISEAREKISGNDLLIYIVGWNDHFFLLKADVKAYYIIDTLGERLFEGCDRGYILRFDSQTKIYKNHLSDLEESSDEEEEPELLFSGYECCKHYFQNFLTALPLKEAVENNKNGLLNIERLYSKLQIEFSYTKPAVGGCTR